MIKTHADSRFELRSMESIRDTSDVDLQTEKTVSTLDKLDSAITRSGAEARTLCCCFDCLALNLWKVRAKMTAKKPWEAQ